MMMSAANRVITVWRPFLMFFLSKSLIEKNPNMPMGQEVSDEYTCVIG